MNTQKNNLIKIKTKSSITNSIIKYAEICKRINSEEDLKNEFSEFTQFSIYDELVNIPQYCFNYVNFNNYFNTEEYGFDYVNYIPFLCAYFKVYMSKYRLVETNLTKILNAVNFSVQYKDDSHLSKIKQTLWFLCKENYISIIDLDIDRIQSLTPKNNITICVNPKMLYLNESFLSMSLKDFIHIISNNYRKISNKNLLLVYLNILNQIKMNTYYIKNQNPKMLSKLNKIAKENNIFINEDMLYFGSVGYKKIAKQTTLSVHTVMECVELLKNMNILYVYKCKLMGANKANIYALDPAMLSDKDIINDYLEYCI